MQQWADLKSTENHSYNEVADMTGISRRTLIRYKKEHTL
jgi:DNA invertase Pin-like site-specific DNA recombinase